jgi:hypothetical protein
VLDALLLVRPTKKEKLRLFQKMVMHQQLARSKVFVVCFVVLRVAVWKVEVECRIVGCPKQRNNETQCKAIAFAALRLPRLFLTHSLVTPFFLLYPHFPVTFFTYKPKMCLGAVSWKTEKTP